MSDSDHFQRAPGAPALPDTPFRFVLHFFLRFKGWYALMIALEALNAAFGITIPYALSRIIHTVTATSTSMAAATASPALEWNGALRQPLLLFVVLCIGELVSGRMAGAIQVRLGPRQRQNVTRHIYHYLQLHSHRYMTNNFAGALAHRISETSLGVSQIMWSVITEFWPLAIVLSVAVGLLLHAYLWLGVLVGAWAVVFIALSYRLAMRGQGHARHAAAARSETTGKVVDSVSNADSVRLFARLRFEREHLELYLRRELAAIKLSNDYAERVRWFQFGAAALLKIGTLLYALLLWQQQKIGVADFVMAVSLSLMIINEGRNLSRRFLEFFEYVGNVANGVQAIVQPHELVDSPHAQSHRVGGGAIEFRDVHFSHGHGKPLFEGLNVTIPAGQHVGLVGTSGSGKSTFVSLILRTIDPQQGSIHVDGVDLRDFTQEALHEQLSLIPQEPSLFHRTLRENIRYGRLEAGDAEVETAARKAHAHDFIMQAPQGYEAMVGERGVKLSGGQRQRIAIARVILKGAPVLILDEATSSLDSITEQAIQETLQDVMRRKTVIVVAHRLSTIAHLDRILVFEHGRIVEQGSHAELLLKKGMYARLWRAQAGGFLPENDDALEDVVA
ncbi:ABC transporter ATP-binding protein [Oxalobacteraceae bacterium CAVE-383]|nr:ABC transporter ATP-binding protein [Oxalobacteraceae bacterium CAVE-383]